jgi:hypothetical protein
MFASSPVRMCCGSNLLRRTARATTTRALKTSALALGVALLAFAQGAFAAPTLVSAGQTARHQPRATWTLPPGECATEVEFDRTPVAQDESGYWYSEIGAGLPCSATSWVGRSYRLRPGRWYAHVASTTNDPAQTAMFSNVISFRVPYWPDREFALSSSQPESLPHGYTYRGDTVRASFRDLNARGRSIRYRVCHRRNFRNVCVRKRTRGARWSTWRVYIGPFWAGFNNGRYTRRVVFRWYVGVRFVKSRALVVYE